MHARLKTPTSTHGALNKHHAHAHGRRPPPSSGDSCSGANGYEYIDRAVCKGVAYETAAPYKAYDYNRCPAISRYVAGIKGYTHVPGNTYSVRRALAHNGKRGLRKARMACCT